MYRLLMMLLVASPVLAANAPLIASGPNPAAPKQVKQYGQLQGDWRCKGSSAQPDGSFAESPGEAHWSWYYVLDGYAVQDVWKPAPGSGPWGTNLRTYDAENDQWYMVWTTQTQATFDHFTATFDNGMIVMRGERPAGQRPAHAAKITFFNITREHFDWKYEATAPATDTGWVEFSRLSCDRTQDGA